MRRRHFLQLLAASALAPAMECLSAKTAKAQVEVALAVIQTGLALAHLFGGSGDGAIFDLMSRQVEMLKAISDQIALVQQGIVEILNNLDQLKDMVRDLPAQTVMELCKDEIGGTQGLYLNEIMPAYQSDRIEKGIDYARSKHLPDFSAALTRLQNARSTLMYSYKNFLLVPPVSTSAFLELSLLVICDATDNTVAETINAYNSWLTEVRGSEGSDEATLAGSISKASSRVAELRQASTTAATSGECMTQLLYSGISHSCGGESLLNLRSHTFEFNAAIQPISNPEIAGLANEMVKSGVLPETEIPSIINAIASFGPDQKKSLCHPYRRGRNYHLPEPPEWLQLTQLANTPCDRAVADFDNRASAWSAELQNLTLRLMSLRALDAAASGALQFVAGFQQRLSSTR
jgi:hypothetical protein